MAKTVKPPRAGVVHIHKAHGWWVIQCRRCPGKGRAWLPSATDPETVTTARETWDQALQAGLSHTYSWHIFGQSKIGALLTRWRGQ